jgi:hypothetical protein
VPRNPATTKTLEYSSFGYWQRDSADTGTVWQAHVALPDGALACWLDGFFYDADAVGDIFAIFVEYPGYDSGTVTNVDREAIASTGSSGYQYVSAAIGGSFSGIPACRTVNTDVRYDGGAFHTLYLNIPAATTSESNLRFKGADIWWKRQVRAAPGVASFNDVPTSHWAFQQIEALKKSGITTGCVANVSFCPDNTMTRAEMAVFLARALGLSYSGND